MSVQPTADGVRSAVKAVKQAHPELGVKRVVAEVKLAFPAWEIGAKEVRQALADLKSEAEAEAAGLCSFARWGQLKSQRACGVGGWVPGNIENSGGGWVGSAEFDNGGVGGSPIFACYKSVFICSVY